MSYRFATIALVLAASGAGAQPAPADIEAAKTACVSRLRADIPFRDPDSVKVAAVERRGLFQHRLIGKTVRVYRLSVNATNAFGGWTGARPYMCFTDPADERLVLAVQDLEDVR